MHEWVEKAHCRELEVATDVFFPRQNEYAQARRICNDCTVQRECLESTLWRDNDNYGMFGGLTPMERQVLRDAYRGTTTSNPAVIRVKLKGWAKP